jgi:hypothetical protein
LTPKAGLEKLGFPWILSSEMSLFNGLQRIFAERFIRAPSAPREPGKQPKRRAQSLKSTRSTWRFIGAIVSNISEYGNILQRS